MKSCKLLMLPQVLIYFLEQAELVDQSPRETVQGPTQVEVVGIQMQGEEGRGRRTQGFSPASDTALLVSLARLSSTLLMSPTQAACCSCRRSRRVFKSRTPGP
jgi:hypothetical protein